MTQKLIVTTMSDEDADMAEHFARMAPALGAVGAHGGPAVAESPPLVAGARRCG